VFSFKYKVMIDLKINLGIKCFSFIFYNTSNVIANDNFVY